MILLETYEIKDKVTGNISFSKEPKLKKYIVSKGCIWVHWNLHTELIHIKIING